MPAFPPPPPFYEAAPGVWRVVLPWTHAHILTARGHTKGKAKGGEGEAGGDWSLVDSGTRWDRKRLLAAVRALGLSLARCRQVLLTHGHCDHAGNAAFFAATCNAALCAHLAERPFIESGRTYAPRGVKVFSVRGAMQAAMFGGGEVVYPVRRRRFDALLQDGDLLQTPAGAWRVLHTPGHTPGHVSLLREEDGVLLSGDALLNLVPFKRTEGLCVPSPLFNWNTGLARSSAMRLAALQPRVLLPGHGRPLGAGLGDGADAADADAADADAADVATRLSRFARACAAASSLHS